MAVEFTFPDPAPRLSLNGRLHWRRHAEYTKQWRHAAFVYGRVSRINARHTPANIQVTFDVADLRRRDPHNLIATVKPIVDGLVDAGYWPDDTADWVTVLDPMIRKFADGKRTRISISPRAVA